MAGTDFKLRYRIEADGKSARAEFADIDKLIDRVGAKTRRGGGGLADVFGGNLASQAVSRLSSTLLEGGRAVLDYSARMEQTKIGFTTLMGGAQNAATHLKALQDFAKSTPFEFESLTKASRRLQNVGLEGKQVIPVLRDIGNAAAAVGASSEELDSITLAFSQIIAKGKLSAEEVNQLAERGIPVWRMLEEQLGRSKGEIIKLAEQGKISSDVFLKAFSRFSQMNFGDAMAKQSKTFSGAMSNIKDAAIITADTAFKPIFDKISRFAVDVADSLQRQENDPKLKASGVSFGFALGQAIRKGIDEGMVGQGGPNLTLGGASTGNVLMDVLGRALIDFSMGIATPPPPARRGASAGKFLGGGQASAPPPTLGPDLERLQKERDAILEKQRSGELGQLAALQEAEKHYLDRMTVELKRQLDAREISSKEYLEKRLANEEEFAKGAIENIDKEFELQKQKANTHADELLALEYKNDNERQKIVDERYDREEAAKRDVAEADKRLDDDKLAAAREAMERSIALQESEMGLRYANVVKFAAAEMRSAEDVAKFKEFLEVDLTEFRIQKLKDYSQLLDKNSKEYLDIQNQIKVLENQLEAQRATNATNEKQRHKDRIKSWGEYLQRIKAVSDAEFEADEREAERNRRRYEAGTITGGTGIGAGIASGMGVELVPMFDEATNAMLTFQDRLAMVGDDINNFVGGALGGLIDGLGQMAIAWLTTGDFSVAAALKMASGVALSIAMQAGIKALFEFAEAAAAAARLDPIGATMHAAAGKLYLGVVAASAGIGIGLGLAGRAAEGGSKGGGGGGSSSSTYTGRQRQEDLQPISRVSDDAYISGRRTDPATLALARAVEKLEKKFDAFPPEYIVGRAAERKRGLIATEFNKDIAKKPQLGSQAMRTMGGR